MVEASHRPTNEAQNGLTNRLATAGGRAASVTALATLMFSSTAAAQIEGTNPAIQFANDVAPVVIPTIMVFGAILAVAGFGASNLVTNPETQNRMKQMMKGGAIAFAGTPIIAGFIDYIAPAVPFSAADGVDLVPFAVFHVLNLL